MGFIAAEDKRVHIHTPEEWNRGQGTDYWAVFGPESISAAAGSSALITDSGWTATSLVETAGTGADFLATADRSAPPHVLTDASGDLLQSPAIFGDYGHAQIAARILGYTPTKMSVEWYGAMTVSSAQETVSGWGLIEAGGSPANANDAMAFIWADGVASSAFQIRSPAAGDGGASLDATWHRFRITGTFGGTWEWFIDETSQGTLAIQTDLFPVSFGMHATTTNRPALAWVHVWYE